ncbi:MAG: hypothetical protein AAFP78_07410 [Pseudomonadota bacterium]
MSRFIKSAAALAVAAFAFGAAPSQAADFSEGSEAKEWGLQGEEKARFTGKVVDVLCELTGDCAANCGDNRRQLAILRDADNALVFALKNRQAAFTGAATDLHPFCGKAVEVDGVTIQEEEKEGAPKYYMVQLIKEVGAEEWTKTSRWTKEWAKANPDQKGVKGPWFRKDPRIKVEIEREGYLGLGLEIDKAFIEYYHE